MFARSGDENRRSNSVFDRESQTQQKSAHSLREFLFAFTAGRLTTLSLLRRAKNHHQAVRAVRELHMLLNVKSPPSCSDRAGDLNRNAP